MAKSILTADIPGIGKINVEGNHATEESIQALINAFGTMKKINNQGIRDLNSQADDAAENLDEFSDELERADRSQKKLTDTVLKAANATGNGIKGMQRFADSGGNLSSMVESLGGVAESIGRGIGGLVPVLGEGLEELGGAAASAVVGLTTLAISTVESYIGLNKSIANAGLQVEGGFAGFADFAEAASLPLNEFSNAMMQSTDRLRLFGSGAPGGIRNVSNALKQLKDDGIMENLYSLGFTTEEVVAGMADYSVAAHRAGESLSAEELAAGSAQYLKNLRELSRLSGKSVAETQAQIDADRSSLFIQNQLAGLNAEQRSAMEQYIAGLTESERAMMDFALTGESQTVTSGMQVEQNRAFADIMRQTVLNIVNSNGDLDTALSVQNQSLRENADLINAQTRQTQATFGQTVEDVTGFGTQLGAAGVDINKRLGAAFGAEIVGEKPKVEPGSMEETMGNLEVTLNNVQSEIQSVFLDSVKLMAPAITNVAKGVDGTAESIGNFKRLLEGVVSGDFSAVNDALGTNLQNNTTNTMMENLTEVIAAGIEEGFRRLLGDSWVGSRLIGDPDEYLAPENYTAPMGNLGLGNRYDGMATGGIAVGPDSGYPMELHGTEAVVPLPDGRSIPVEMTTSGIRGLIEAMAMQESTDNNAGTSGISLAAIQDNFANSQPLTAQNLASSFDNTRTLPELVQVNKSMLAQLSASTQKLDQMVRALEESNTISRNSAYARA
jgi:hypothetical protein